MRRDRIALFEGLDWEPTPITWPPRVGFKRIPTRKLHSTRLMLRFQFRMDLYEKQRGRCWWCGQEMSLEATRLTSFKQKVKGNRLYATFEHLLPKSEGGGFCEKNIRLAHQGCNEKRHRTNTPQWLVKLYPVMYCWEEFYVRTGRQRDGRDYSVSVRSGDDGGVPADSLSGVVYCSQLQQA